MNCLWVYYINHIPVPWSSGGYCTNSTKSTKSEQIPQGLTPEPYSWIRIEMVTDEHEKKSRIVHQKQRTVTKQGVLAKEPSHPKPACDLATTPKVFLIKTSHLFLRSMHFIHSIFFASGDFTLLSSLLQNYSEGQPRQLCVTSLCYKVYRHCQKGCCQPKSCQQMWTFHKNRFPVILWASSLLTL